MMNLTAFALEFERPELDRLRLCVHTAPGGGRSLARYLHDFAPSYYSDDTVAFEVPKKIAELLPELTDEGDLIEVVREYANLWQSSQEEAPVSYELHRARVVAAESCRILSLNQRSLFSP